MWAETSSLTQFTIWRGPFWCIYCMLIPTATVAKSGLVGFVADGIAQCV
jgi:hypothetical protein